MEILQLDLGQLIPKVSAEGLDALVQPTFGTLDTSGNPTTLASVRLTANSTSVAIGSTFEVDIDIATGNFAISEYHLVIDYDTAKLSVVDAQPTVSGTQIEFLDTVFNVASGDNTVSSTGVITLVAKTPSGNALQVNRTVGRIKFQAQQTGVTTIEPLSGVQGTQLINQNGIAIATSLNSLTLNAIQATNSSSTTTIAASGSSSSSNTTSTSGDLPATGIGDDVLALSPLFLGSLLIALGFNLRRHRRKLK